MKVSSVDPTTAGNDGLFNMPGEGCVTSAPLTSCLEGIHKHVRKVQTYDECVTCERGQMRIMSNGIDTAELGINSESA